MGGTCLNIGCIPTKALLESSGLFDRVNRHRGEFGVIADGVGFDMAALGARRDRIVSQLVRGVGFLMRKNGVTVIDGQGVLTAADTVRVGETDYRAGAVIVATGSTARPFPGVDFDGVRVISSDHAVKAERLPASIAIVGAGAVGVEFATFYSQLGVPVTLIEALDRLVPLEDEEVSKELLRQFRARGIDCRVGARVERITPGDTEVSLTVDGAELRAEQLLVAIGRVPLSGGIGLEALGVALRPNGTVQTDEWMRTNVPGIWAIGDVAGGYLLAHAAAHEGVVAAEDIAGKRQLPMEQELVTRCTYSQPEIASVGLSEAQAVAAGHRVKTGKFPFAANGRALIHGEGGFVKVVADADSGRVLGTHIIGPSATELIAEAGLALLFQADAWELSRNIHPHPTLSEAIGEAALAVDGLTLNV